MIPAVTDGRTLDAIEGQLRALLDARRYADGEAVAREGLVIYPDSALLHRLLSELLSGQEQYDDARAAAETACALDPHDATAARNLSYRCGQSGDRAGAIEAAQRGIALAPDSW